MILHRPSVSLSDSPSLTQCLMVSENLYVRVLRWVMKWAASIFNLQSVSWIILKRNICKCQISLCFTLFLQNITRRFLRECLTGCCCFLIFKVLIWIFYAYMKLSVLSTWAFKKQHACYDNSHGKLTLKWYAGFGVAELNISQQDKFLFFAKLCKVLVESYIVKTSC